MPVVNVSIPRAWRYRDEPNRIHYVAATRRGERHLVADAGTALYDLLDAQLLAMGYTGPPMAEVVSDRL